MKLLTKIAAATGMAAAIATAAPMAASAAPASPAINVVPCNNSGFTHLSGPSGDICFANGGTQSGMNWWTDEVIAGANCGTVFFNGGWLDFSAGRAYGFPDGNGHALTVDVTEVVIFGC